MIKNNEIKSVFKYSSMGVKKEIINLKTTNCFNIEKIALKIKETLKDKEPLKLYLGYDEIRTKADIVILTDKGYVFIPLEERLAALGGCWSSSIFLLFYYAQKNLSESLEKLGRYLHIEIEDRCLYGWFLTQMPVIPKFEKECIDKDESDALYQLQEEIKNTYKIQLEEMSQYPDWLEYHNHGFAFKYLPIALINNGMNEIYNKREIFEANNYWEETKEIIRAVYDTILKF